MNVYGIGKRTLGEIRSEIKQGFVDSDTGNRDSTTDGSCRASEKNNPVFVRKERGIFLHPYQLATLAVSNTVGAFSWLDDYFSLVGQVEPNGNDIEM